MSATELKPCPFCGGDTELKEYKPNVSGVAICKECGARSPICKNDHVGGWKPKAIAAWNTRAERTCHVNELDALTQTLSMANGCSWGECSECGYLTPTDSVFCVECGAKVVE